MNNIFDFATSELSQDAVICWCINWYNDKESKLYPFAVEMLKLFTDFDENTDTEITIKQQLFKVDILIYFHKSGKAVIVEDKVFTSEHDDQIAKYREKLAGLSNDEKCELGIEKLEEDLISTVYFKTGFFYDNDKLVVADRIIDGKKFLGIVEKYKNANYMLEMYIDYLARLVGWYDIYGEFKNPIEESFWSWNIANYQIAQYKLMRAIFPETKWDRTKDEYKVYHGSNRGGTPWTEMLIYKGKIGTDNAGYGVFWRIDTDNAGPYISLRFYDDYDKSNDKEKEEHVEQYRKHFYQVKSIFMKPETQYMWTWGEVMPGKTENYKESTLIHIHIDKILIDWDNYKDQFIADIVKITDEFVILNRSFE